MSKIFNFTIRTLYNVSTLERRRKIIKNKTILYVLVLIIGLFVGYVFINSKNLTNRNPQSNNYRNNIQNGQLNKGNCLADDCLLIKDLEYPVGELPENIQATLEEAINDEYKALSTYQTIVEKFGPTRPFSMIIGAEEQHIASLKSIYNKYGLEAPTNTWQEKVIVPETLQEACQIGVDAEISNAALYKEKLLPEVQDYEDITLVFENLMSASEQKHLPAFEQCN